MEASESFDCRICLQPLSKKEALKPCNCSGSQAYVHRDCLKEWIVIRGYNRCNVCKSEYTGIELKKTPKSFIAWIQEEPEGLGLILVGFLVFGFLFYVLLIGYSQFFTSQGIVANVWRIILIVLVSFFTLLTVIGIFGYTINVIIMFNTWRETHFVIKVMPTPNVTPNTTPKSSA